jgi:hypothetical protein
MVCEGFFKQPMTSVEMTRQKGQARVDLGKRFSLVALGATQKTARKGNLLLDDALLVVAAEKKPHDRVDEELVVERRQDGTDRVLTAD